MENIDLQPVISAAVALMAAIITTVLVPYIKGKLTQQQYDRLLEAVRTAVAAAEQLYPQENSGTDKKLYVRRLLSERGYDSFKPEIDAMIEAAVSKINGVEV